MLKLFAVFLAGAFVLFEVIEVRRSTSALTGRKKLLGAIAGLGVLNFAAFFFVAVVLNGYAFGGYQRDGHYFLGSHGIYTEVSRSVFVYSKWHGYSAVIGIVAALMASLLDWGVFPTDDPPIGAVRVRPIADIPRSCRFGSAGELEMSIFEIGAAAIGFLIIAVTIWKLVRNGIAPSNGKMTEAEDFWIAAPPP